MTPLQLTVRVPGKTQSIRVVTETANGGRIGAADLDRKALDAAPATPAPEPQLLPHQPNAEQAPSQIVRYQRLLGDSMVSVS